MKIKASMNYAIRTVLYLALKDEVCSSRVISEEMNIPRDYLIQLALHLRRSGIVRTKPGKLGGYELAKSPDKISLGAIMSAFDAKGKKAKSRSGRKKNDLVAKVYAIEALTGESLNAYMSAITIADLIKAVDDGGSPKKAIAAAMSKEAKRLKEEAAS